MAKYRKASEKTISRGKGISTDKLSLKDAKDYFNERAKETGAKRFRHNGQVYDLAGNKITESAPARSSGGGSSAAPRPKARPATSAGGAQADQRTSGAPPARPAKSGAKRGEVNPVAVGAGLAAAGAAGVAAVRSGRNAGKPAATATPKTSFSDRVRAAGAKAKAAAMGTPVKPAAKSSTGGPARAPVAQAAKAAPVPKPKAGKKGPGGSRSGVRGGMGVDITTNPLEQIKDPLQLMNKGGMVRKK
jgi:hypothetical protein